MSRYGSNRQGVPADFRMDADGLGYYFGKGHLWVGKEGHYWVAEMYEADIDEFEVIPGEFATMDEAVKVAKRARRARRLTEGEEE